MIALLQRVLYAEVVVEDVAIATIGPGLLVFLGVQRNDDEADADNLAFRLLAYRVFADGMGKMNLSLREIQGGLLLVPQFTLAADTDKGLRPGFSLAAPPEEGKRLYDYLLGQLRREHLMVESGRFGADMQVRLTNDGPVTILLRSKVLSPRRVEKS